jgi:hypothetical protein
MKIELKETFEKEYKEGINLFLGAGFSIFAKDINGKNLPLGQELCKELVSEFSCPDLNDLSKVCTIIDSYASEKLRDYLISRFTVSEYDKFYDILLNVNTPRIFTTNIDDLLSKIFINSRNKFLNNVLKDGSTFNDPNAIDYIPIHGTVEVKDEKFLFNTKELASSFNNRRTAWTNLSIAAEQIPSLFIGYSLNDVGAIESLFNNQNNQSVQKNKWIVLREENVANEAYFKALGFKIIISNTREFLQYLSTLSTTNNKNKSESDYIFEIFPTSKIPTSVANLKIRPIEEFFLGDAPIWSDVISNRIFTTSHLDEILNLVEIEKSVIITGIPASGKSTLLLQLAKKLAKTKRVLLMNDITHNKSNIIKNEIKSPTIILIDNFTNDMDAFLNLESNPYIKTIGFDRYYYVDILSHRLNTNKYNFYDVSDLKPSDIQGIYNTIPLNLRKTPMKTQKFENELPSIFEIVNYNINKTKLNERYIPILKDLERNNPILLELLVMSCYLHSCRTPVSFEVANAYLEDDTSSYNEVLHYMSALKGMVNEVIGTLVDDYNDQDYYQPRSQILAETIIEQTKSSVFKRVFEKFHENVPKHIIPKYYVFKRNAYDAFYITKAFNSWREGLAFYDRVSSFDKTPFILQQCALYLLKKKKYTEAALKIDKAIQISKTRIFSIENTHAIILFKANIGSENLDIQTKDILDRSMQILKKCYQDDQRKTYHAITFAEQSLEYFSRFGDATAMEYLELASKWLSEIEVEKKYNHRAKTLISQIQKIM